MKKYKGILFILLSAFCFALMGMFVNLAGDLPSIEKSFFRNLVALIFAWIILKKNKVHFSGKKGNLKYLIARSVAGTVGILCNFYAVDHLVLSDASMLNKTHRARIPKNRVMRLSPCFINPMYISPAPGTKEKRNVKKLFLRWGMMPEEILFPAEQLLFIKTSCL